MNERQIQIADKILNILVDNGGRANESGVRSMLNKEFTEHMDPIEISYVFEILTDDYELITNLGQAWIRLTPEGEKMAKRGMKRYRQQLSFREWINESKLCAFLLFIGSTLLGAIITLLVSKILK